MFNLNSLLSLPLPLRELVVNEAVKWLNGIAKKDNNPIETAMVDAGETVLRDLFGVPAAAPVATDTTETSGN